MVAIVIILGIGLFLTLTSLIVIKNDQNKKIKEIEKDFYYEIKKLKRSIFKLNNPVFFKHGDTLWYYDEQCCNDLAQCKCLGLHKMEEIDNLERTYYVEINKQLIITSTNNLYKDKKDCQW